GQYIQPTDEPGERQRDGQIFRPGKFPRHPDRQVGGEKAADNVQRRACEQQRPVPEPRLHEPSISCAISSRPSRSKASRTPARSAASRFWLSLYLPSKDSIVSSKPTMARSRP